MPLQDASGNLTSWKTQNGAATQDLESHSYTYGNTDWKDLLTGFDGQSITYDTSGNPLSYYNGKRYTMTWRNGRELDSLTVGGKKTSYQYDVNGLRTKKTNPDGSYTQYYIVDGLTVGERRFTTTGSVSLTLRYLYDESRSPVGFGLKYPTETGWTNYYFAKNLQGDVTAIYRSDASGGSYTGTLVAKYAYDPFGQVLSVTNASGTAISATAANVANYNPFRYRGYYYDTESGFYYLQSRYYDPEICRFINADKYAGTGLGFIGSNMFAYCNNNSVTMVDNSGKYPKYATAMTDSGMGGQVHGPDNASKEYDGQKSKEFYQHLKNTGGFNDFPGSVTSISIKEGGPKKVTAWDRAYDYLIDTGIGTAIGVLFPQYGGFIGFGLGLGSSFLSDPIPLGEYDTFIVTIQGYYSYNSQLGREQSFYKYTQTYYQNTKNRNWYLIESNSTWIYKR